MKKILRKLNNYPIVWILLLAAFLRLLGIWHGYPHSFFPDEAHFVKRALSFGSFDFNPHWFHKPAFYMYLLFFEYGLYFIIGKILGLWQNVSNFAVNYIINPGPLYLIGRITTTLFGIGTIYTTYRLGEKHFGKNCGQYGSLLLTLSYAHIVSSQDIKADVPAAFFAILSMLILLDYLNNKEYKYIFLSSAIAGIGAATKIYPIVMLVPIILSVIYIQFQKRNNGNNISKLNNVILFSSVGFFIFWLFYFICSPYSFIDSLGRYFTFKDFFTVKEKLFSFFGAEISAKPNDFISQRESFPMAILNYFYKIAQYHGMGIVIFFISIIGTVFIILRNDIKSYIFFVFPLLFAFISIFTRPGYPDPRHQLPLYPFLTIGGGALLAWLSSSNIKIRKIIFYFLLIILLWPLFNIIQRGLFVSKADTRNIATEWITTYIPENTKILLDENGPQLLPSSTQLIRDLTKAKKAAPAGQFTAHYDKYLSYQLLAANQTITYDIFYIRLPWWREKETEQGVHDLTSEYDRDMGNPLKPVGVNPYQYYLENNFKYAIVHSYKYAQFLDSNSTLAQNFPSFAQFYQDLFEKGTLVKEINPQNGVRPGPVVKIFQFEHD